MKDEKTQKVWYEGEIVNGKPDGSGTQFDIQTGNKLFAGYFSEGFKKVGFATGF